MVTLRMVDLIQVIFVNKLMLCVQLRLLWIVEYADLNQQILHPIGALNLIKVKLRLQCVINLIIGLEQIVDHLDDRVVEAERLRIRVTAQLVRNVHFLPLF